MSQCSEAEFLRNVAQHEMQIIRDEDVYRHLRFKQPGAINRYFDLLTWPGHLCYTGDMGTFVFTRIKDMFEFFRTDREYAKRDGRRLYINPDYWAEKLIAADDRRGGGSATQFSEDKFRRVINEQRIKWIRDARRERTLDADSRRDLWESIERDVFDRLDDDGGQVAYVAARDFQWWPSRPGERVYQFEELWDYDLTEYTHRYLWCCYALAWGIERYDDAKQPAQVAS